MEQMEQKEHGVGNTIPPRAKSRKWCFTLNNYSDEELKNMEQIFGDSKYIFGKEIGESKTPHIQGYVERKNPIAFSSMKKRLPRAHIEKARGSTKQNYDYCSKDGDFITNIDLRTPAEKLVQLCLDDEYKDVEWKPWQIDIIAKISDKPNKRQILWFWDDEGNTGKSYLCKYLALTKNVIIADGKKADIFNQVKTAIDAGKIPKIILLDVPRSSQGYVQYGVIEQLKNGCIYSGKYEGGQLCFPIPHVICFANCEPEYSQMSLDRWFVEKIE